MEYKERRVQSAVSSQADVQCMNRPCQRAAGQLMYMDYSSMQHSASIPGHCAGHCALPTMLPAEIPIYLV
jgi:hypothetical protein